MDLCPRQCGNTRKVKSLCLARPQLPHLSKGCNLFLSHMRWLSELVNVKLYWKVEFCSLFIYLVPRYTWIHWGRAYPQHISTEQVHSGWVNCYKNLWFNLIPADPKRFLYFIGGEKSEHRVQRVAWQPVTESGTFRPALMTFPLDSTIQAILAGVGSHCSGGHD